MLIRSRKYILLVVVNVVLLSLVFLERSNTESDVFNTDFVVEILAEKEAEKSQKEALEKDLLLVSNQMMRFKEQLAQTQQLILKSEAKFDVCTIEKNNLLQSVNEVVTKFKSTEMRNNEGAKACKAIEQEFAVTRQQTRNLESRIDQLTQQNAKLMSDLADATRDSQLATESTEIKALRQRVQQLENDINSPVYLKSVYIKERQCEQSRFADRVCIEEFLVRPEFSKAPITDVLVKIVDMDNNVITQAEFSSKRAQLMRLPLGKRGAEINAGRYIAIFSLNDRVVESSPFEVAQS